MPKQETSVCSVAWVEILPFRRWLFSVNHKTLRKDLLAGLTGAMIVLPQGVAFAAIAGLPPQYGLYTAMVPAIVAALFGSSRHLISGPTTAISIVVFSTLAPMADPGSSLFIRLALTLALMAGLFQLALGLARMGTLVNFVSHSVVVGFTSGAAILIASSQLKHLLGIAVPSGSSFLETWGTLLSRLGEVNPAVLGVGLITLGSAIAIRTVNRWLPHMLIAMVIGSIAAFFLDAQAHDIRLVGALPSSLPPLSSPVWEGHIWRELASGALAVALLGLIEAVSIARSVSLKSQQRLNGSQEFIGQGLSNIIGSFFSCYPSSGSFTRSGINYDSGAQTPMAAMFASVSLMALVLGVAHLAAYLPIAAMAGLILLVSYNLINFKEIRLILRTSRSETAVMGVTFAATLFVELEFAIYVGVMLSLVLYLGRAAAPRMHALIPNPGGLRRLVPVKGLPECLQLKIVEINGALFFGAVNHVDSMLDCMLLNAPNQKYLLLVGSGINFIDVAGVEMLINRARTMRAQGGDLFLSDINDQVRDMFERSGYAAQIGRDHLFHSKSHAIRHIVIHVLNRETCKMCRRGLFFELECLKQNPTFGRWNLGSIQDAASQPEKKSAIPA